MWPPKAPAATHTEGNGDAAEPVSPIEGLPAAETVCVESRERSLSTVEIDLAEMTIALPDAIEVSSPADDAKTPEEGTTAEK